LATIPPPPKSTLFPYTTLFRSRQTPPHTRRYGRTRMMCGGMMLLLIPGAISNSNAVIRQEFRKLRFQMIDDTKTSAVSMAVEKGAKTAVVWLLFTLPLSLLEGGVLSERPAAVKGAPALRGEANPSRRGPF